MNPLNKSLLATLTLGAALALTACGSGSDEPPETVPAGVLPGGNNPVGTCGDGVNLNEYNAINGKMSREEILAIVCDTPTRDATSPAYGVPWLYWDLGNTTFVSWDMGRNKKAGNSAAVYQTNF